MRRFLALIIAMLLLASIPAIADASQVRTSGLFTYEIKGNGTATITGFNWDANGTADVYIPRMLDGYTVTAIGDEAFKYPQDWDWFSSDYNRNYQPWYTPISVRFVMPDTISSIGERAFWGVNVETINITPNLLSIGDGAFAFGVSFQMQGKNPVFSLVEGNLYVKADKELIAYSGGNIAEGITSIAPFTFFGHSFEDGIKIPSTVSKIGDYAFYGVVFVTSSWLNGMTSMNLENVTYIGSYAFANSEECRVRLSSRLEYIGDYAFCVDGIPPYHTETEVDYAADGDYYSGLPMYRFSIPDSVEYIGEGCLQGTYTYIRVNPGSKLRTIPAYAFVTECDVTIAGEQITSINAACAGRKSELTIDCPNWTTIIGDSFTCRSVNALPKNITCITSELFRTAKFTGTIPETVTHIESFAFGTEYAGPLPSKIEQIDSCAFAVVVTDMYLPVSLKKMADDAFPRGSTFVVESGSYGERWCSENGFGYTVNGYVEDLSWLE